MLTAADLATIKADLEGLAPDAEQPFTFFRYAGTTPGDRAAGTAETAVYNPPQGLPVAGMVYPYEVSTEGRQGGKVATGEVVFRIRQTLYAPKPVADDRIAWQGSSYSPVHVDDVRLGTGLVWAVRCQKL